MTIYIGLLFFSILKLISIGFTQTYNYNSKENKAVIVFLS